MEVRGGRRGGGGAIDAVMKLLLFLALFFFFISLGNANTDPNDVTALNVLYGTLKSPTQLTNWMSQDGDPCGQQWTGITCTASRVTAIKLSGMGLTGQLGYNMNTLTALLELDLSNNNLGGSDIPYNLPPNLERLNLAGNQFTGTVPYSISSMVSLQYLNIGHNQLSNINDMFQHLGNLTLVDLSFNAFPGSLPQSFSSLTALKTLYLQNNKFSGTLDVLANLPLTDLNVANNQFTGWIPEQLKSISNLETSGNSFSQSPAPPPPPSSPPPAPASNPPPSNLTPPKSTPSNSAAESDSGKTPPPSKDAPDAAGDKKRGGLGVGGIVGIAVSAAAITGIVAFLLISRRRRTISTGGSAEPDLPFSPLEEANKEMSSKNLARDLDLEALPKATVIGINSFSLKPPPKIDLHRSFDENDQYSKSLGRKISISSVKASVYTVADLQVATNSFSADNLLGEGSFGRVYRAWFKDGTVLAVKKINLAAFPDDPSSSFIQLVAGISRLNHPNLSEFVGYCAEHGQSLLVYEFYRHGSLHDFLHLSDEYSNILSWSNRVKIALGSAKALEYLHEVCSPSVIHKNFKSANILLDADFNPHLSDCGFSELNPNQDFQASSQNSGYAAPEISQTGQYSMKSDVYSFGVVMLELLTGRMAIDSTRPRSEQSLVRWATPQLHDIDALDRMVDPALKGQYPAKSLSRFADIVALCIQPEPEFRPPMSEVVQSLLRLVQRADMSKRVPGLDGQITPRRYNPPDEFF